MIRAWAHTLWLSVAALLLAVGVAVAQDNGATGDADAPPQEQASASANGPAGSIAAEMMQGIDAPEGAPDYQDWAEVAARAEQVLEVGRASDAVFQRLREEIDRWRSDFAAARDENKVRITTLRNQIAALPEPPAEGETESRTLASQRQELTDALAQIETPVRAAEVAYARADTIIEEIDATLRSRQTEELFAAGPSPLNPAVWPDALAQLQSTARMAGRAVATSFDSSEQRAELRRTIVPVLLLLVVAFVLLWRGRTWVMRAGDRVRERGDGPSRGVWSFLISLGQVVVPVIGLAAAVVAFSMTGVMGFRAEVVSAMALSIGISLIVARWLGVRVFGAGIGEAQVLQLDTTARIEGRVEATLLGLAYGLYAAVQTMSEFEQYDAATVAVLEIGPMLLAGVLMVRMGRLLLNHRQSIEDDDSEEGPSFIDRSLSFAGRLLMIVGVVGPLLAFVGYSQLAGNAIFNTALTFGAVGVLLVLHGFFVDLYGMVRRLTQQEASEALLPVLASFAMLILSTPIFALIWGARETDLREIWGTIMRGVTLGETVISPTDVLLLIIVFLLGVALTRLIQGMLKTTVLPKTRIDIGGRNAITSGIGYVGIFLAAVVAITSVGINLSSLAVVAGALSVGIGFGLQNIVSNFVSGIILLIERPISEGDWIDTGGHMGIVKDISVRSTTIETFDRTDVVIPNSDLISGVVTNYTQGNRVGRLVIDVGVAYGSDTKRVKEILTEIVMDHPMVTVNPEPQVGFMEFGDSALMFQIRAILSDVFFVLVVRDEINHEIARRFAEEGVEIPFVQRDLWIRNPEALRPEPREQREVNRVRERAPDDPNRDPQSDATPEADEGADGD
jgi:small-conductance mechanosensitive channel